MISFDQMGNRLELKSTPRRIVSLVPSQTELLYDLGLDEEVVGITKFCVHPPHWRKSKKIIGGTKQFDLEAIEGLKPDLVIGNKEENYQSGIEVLQREFPVWMSDISGKDDAMRMIQSLADLTDRSEKGRQIVAEIREGFARLSVGDRVPALYLIWRKPWRAAGTGTFIHAMMEETGFQNVMREARYPEIDGSSITKLNPSVVLLSSEPYPFAEEHEDEIRELLPRAKILLVDGEMFSWYGSRMRLAPGYYAALRERGVL